MGRTGVEPKTFQTWGVRPVAHWEVVSEAGDTGTVEGKFWYLAPMGTISVGLETPLREEEMN